MLDFGPVCREHLEFMQWADDLALSALSAVPDDVLTEKRGSSFSSLFETLNHIYVGELIWVRKITVDPNINMADLPVPPDLTALKTSWPGVHNDWLRWATTDRDWTEVLHIPTRHFGAVNMPCSKIVLHVVNHGSYHRGQLATMMRQAGMTPPALDLMLFYTSRQ